MKNRFYHLFLRNSLMYLLSTTTLPTTLFTTPLCPCIQKQETTKCRCIELRGFCDCAAHYLKYGTQNPACPCINNTQEIKVNCPDYTSTYIEVPHGELFDKVTILEIKIEHITDPTKLKNIEQEVTLLTNKLTSLLENNEDLKEALFLLKQKLKEINQELWDVEDAIRLKEAEQSFDQEFINLARGVYMLNDERAAVKRTISTLLHSHLVEEKSYVNM